MCLYIYLVHLEASWSKTSILHKFEDIEALSNHFDISHPYIITNDNFEKVKIMKYFSQIDQLVKICKHFSEISIKDRDIKVIVDVGYNETAILKEIQFFLRSNSKISFILHLQNTQFEEIYRKLKVKINQSVYLFKSHTKEMYESYTINNIDIKRKLGQIYSNNTYIWHNNVNPNFIKRRSNFQGMTLKGMVEFVPGFMQAEIEYVKKSKYYSNNETFLINGYQSGLFNDILQILQNKLNFSTMLYKRKESAAWGFIYPQSNGSFRGTGIVGDLFFKRADIVVAPLGIFLSRALYIDYLPKIGFLELAIYIPKLEDIKNWDLFTFISPLKVNLWIMIVVITMFSAIIKMILLHYYASIKVSNIFGNIWTSFIANFGGKPTSSPIDSKQSYKTIIFTTLLCGSIVWIAYRAFLTSELSQSQKVYPFTDMETLSHTNWR